MRSELRTFLGSADITQLGMALPQARRACQAKFNLIGPCPRALYVKIQAPHASPVFLSVAAQISFDTIVRGVGRLLSMKMRHWAWTAGLPKFRFGALL
jgi:hypothetical protein